MIRELALEELNIINNIGKEIKEDFNLSSLNGHEKVFVYVKDNSILGFIHISILYEIMDILNIAVTDKNKGIGYALIDYVKNLRPEKIMLEVRSKNIPAINLYKKCGFNVIHTRNKYYQDDDALVMEVKL